MDSAADHSRIERRERYGGVLEVTEGGHGQGTRGEGENSRPRHASIISVPLKRKAGGGGEGQFEKRIPVILGEANVDMAVRVARFRVFQ